MSPAVQFSYMTRASTMHYLLYHHPKMCMYIQQNLNFPPIFRMEMATNIKLCCFNVFSVPISIIVTILRFKSWIQLHVSMYSLHIFGFQTYFSTIFVKFQPLKNCANHVAPSGSQVYQVKNHYWYHN